MEIENSILLTAVRNPFQPHSSRLILKREYKVQTVREYIKEVFPVPPEDIEIIASVSNIGIVDLDYIPLPQTNIVFTTIPAGGGDNTALRVVASIAVIIASIYAPYAAPAFAKAYPFAMSMIQAGIAVGGSLIINAILPLQQPGEQEGSPSYSWSGVNVVNEGGAFPVVYGKAKMLPTFIGIYMENNWIPGHGTPDEQTLNILCAIADHSVSSITEIKLNGSLYSDYNDVEVVSDRIGALDQAVIPYFKDTHTSQAHNFTVKSSEWIEKEVPGSDITGIEIGVSFPTGLGYFNNDGNIEILKRLIVVDYARETSPGVWGSWTSWINVYTPGADPTPLRWSRNVRFATPGTYKIRIRSNDDYRPQYRSYVEEQTVDYISGINEDDFTYPGASLLAVKAMATGQLSGGLPTISCVVTRGNITVWEQDGTPHTVASSNPAWACYDVLVNAEYGANTSYTRINYTEFLAWATFCSTNGYTCNIVFDTNMSITEALARISILGRGHVIQRGTNFGVIIDQTDSAVQLFTVGNIIEDSFKISYLSKTDRVNVIETTYFDANLDYEQRSFELRTSDFETSADENKTELVLYGATSKLVALKLTKFLLNCNEHLKTTCEFEVQVDALAATVGDVILVSHDVPQWGYSGRVVSATSNTIVLDREVTYGDGLGTVYHIIVRHYDDDALEEVVITNPGSEITSATLNLTGTWSQIPVVDDVYAFGVIDYVYKEFRVTKISRSQDMFRKINALEYNAAVYSDAASIPDYEDDSALLPFVEGLVAIEIFKKEDGIIKTIVSLSWRGFGLNYLYYKEETADRWVLIDSYSGQTWATVRNLDSGKTYIFAVSTTANPLGDGVYDTITLGEYIEPRLIHIWRVGGLEIVGQGNNTVWQNRDLKLTWNLSTQWFPETADGDAQGAGSFPPMTDFGGYRIKISDQNGNSRREFIQTENFFNYTYEKNSEDGSLGSLSFLSGTGTFLAGEWIYQYPSGAYAKIHSVGGASLQLTNVVGTFVDGQVIYQADYGVELITNGDMELDDNWGNYGTPATNERSITQKHGDTYSRKFTPNATNEGIQGDNFTTTTGSFYIKNCWIYPDDVTTINIHTVKGDASGYHSWGETGLNQDAWNNVIKIYQEDAGGAAAAAVFESGAVTSGDYYIDDVSVKKLTNAALASGTVTFAGSGTSADPEPNLIVQVWARDRFGQESEVPAILSVSNPAPAAPSGLTVTAFLKGGKATWIKSTEIDIDYYKYRTKIESDAWSVWLNTTNTEVIRIITETEQDDWGFDATVYFEVKAVDTFGNESAISSGNVDSVGLYVGVDDVAEELYSSLTITDYDSNTALDLAELYDRTTDSGGVAYSLSGTDKWIEFAYPLKYMIDRVCIWSATTTITGYVAYTEDGTTWNYLKAEADHTLDANGKLLTATNQADAITNYWSLDAVATNNNMAIFPDQIVVKAVRFYMTGTFSSTIHELVFVRQVIAEQVVADQLSAITAALGTISSGLLQSSNIAADAGVLFDLDNEYIKIGGTGVVAAGTAAGIFIGIDGSDYELYVGDGSTKYFQFDGTNINIGSGVLVSGNISSSDWAAAAGVRLDLDNKYLKMGGSNVTAAGAAAGIFLGFDTSYKFYVGDGDDDYIQYDGTNVFMSFGSGGGLIVNIGGDITMIGDASNPAYIFFEGTSYTTGISSPVTDGSSFYITPTDSGSNVNAWFGSAGYSFGTVYIFGSDNVIVGTTDGNAFHPYANNTTNSGTASRCWKDIFDYSGALGTCSERAIKSDISVEPLGLDFINALIPVQFIKQGRSREYGYLRGFTIEDVETALEDVGYPLADFSTIQNHIHKDTKMPIKTMRYGDILPPVVKALQEEDVKIEALIKRVEALEAG